VNDFDTKIKNLLNEHVDERTGPRRAAPAFDPSRTADPSARSRSRGRSPWLFPLVAAAAVIAVAAGTVGVSRLAADNHDGPANSPTSSAPAPIKKSGPVLAGASIALPKGWVARPYERYLPPPVEGQLADPDPGWCLTPATTPVKIGGCPVWFRQFRLTHQNLMNVDSRGGSNGNPAQVCVPGHVTHSTDQVGEPTFGGRAAEYRRWTYDCSSGKPFLAEQYVVPTLPAYVLLSEAASPAVHRAMSEIAAASSLPPATSGLRLSDFGYVRQIKVVATGIRITLDRVADVQKIRNTDPATYDYVVPNAVYAQAHLTIGGLAFLATDGKKVVDLYPVNR
jgi:hypothetical protein